VLVTHGAPGVPAVRARCWRRTQMLTRRPTAGGENAHAVSCPFVVLTSPRISGGSRFAGRMRGLALSIACATSYAPVRFCALARSVHSISGRAAGDQRYGLGFSEDESGEGVCSNTTVQSRECNEIYSVAREALVCGLDDPSRSASARARPKTMHSGLRQWRSRSSGVSLHTGGRRQCVAPAKELDRLSPPFLARA
jgi:hypothetical protein